MAPAVVHYDSYVHFQLLAVESKKPTLENNLIYLTPADNDIINN